MFDHDVYCGGVRCIITGKQTSESEEKACWGYIMATSDTGIWNPLLKKYCIWGPDNILEATIAKVKVDAFKQRKARAPIETKRNEIHTIYTGRPAKEGEWSKASL